MTDMLLSKRVRGRLSKLESDIQNRIKNALRDIDFERDLLNLSGEDVYKLRVSDYRLIVDWDQSSDTV